MLSPLTAQTQRRELAKASATIGKSHTVKAIGGYWRPLDFDELLDYTEQSLKSLGIAICKNWLLHLSRNDADLTASMRTTQWPGKIALPGSFVPALGLIATNARRFRTTLYYGVTRLDSMTSMVFGDIAISKKNTLRMDLTETIPEVVQEWWSQTCKIPKIITKLTKIKLDKNELNRIIMAAGKVNCMPWSRLGATEARYRETNGKTAWDLFQAYGFVAAANTPVNYFARSYNFYRLMIGERVTSKP